MKSIYPPPPAPHILHPVAQEIEFCIMALIAALVIPLARVFLICMDSVMSIPKSSYCLSANASKPLVQRSYILLYFFNFFSIEFF